MRLPPAPDSRLAVSVDAVDAPRRARVHAQPAGPGLHLDQVVVAREGVVALEPLEAINFNREDGRVLGHVRDGLMRHVWGRQ